MTFEEILDRAIAMLQRRGRLTYGTLKRQFQLDDAALEDLKNELIEGQRLAVDERGNVLVWTGAEVVPLHPTTPPASPPDRAPLAYTPTYLVEKILTSRSALEGERKQVTVMFADLKGSMELLADRDPEDARAILDPVLERMMDAVHRYEGTVNQVMGDGIMALFGAPLAHEDHAVRACYAALAMQEAIRRYSAEVRHAHGVEVQTRVGLNSGEVVVRAIGNDLHMDYSAIGETTHLAARMEQLALPGTIRLTAATLRLVEGLLRVTPLGPVPVKGLTEPVEVFDLVGVSALRHRLQAAAARGLTPFVGRQTELDVVQRALAQIGAGQGQVVALVGEAGVGKSRLVYECVHAHFTQGWRVLESASVSYGQATPYFPVLDLLRRYCAVDDRDDTRTVRAKVTGQVLTLEAALQDTIPALLALLEALSDDSPFRTLDPSQRRQRTLEGLKRVLLRESQVQPLVLVFEDLHWIDAETQALLDRLVESLPTAQILLLVNYRPDYQHTWGSKTYYSQLRLDPLPPASAEALLQALLGDDPSLAPLTPILIARTEGNPFFLEESIRTLVETQVLVGERGAYRLAHALPSIQVPATVQAVLAARIDRLPPDEKHLLQAAAVIGKNVPAALLQATAEVPWGALQRSLAHLQAAEFLYETTLFPELAYTFKLALTQDVAYNAVLLVRRRVLHERAAQAIEGVFAERLPEHYYALAHHYSRSGNTPKAVDYLHRAGQQAVERSAYTEAISHLTTALDLLATLPETRERSQRELGVQMTLGMALRPTKGTGTPEVEQLYTRARQLCEGVGEPPQLFRVLWGLWSVYNARGENQVTRALGEQLLSLAQRLQDPDLLLEAHHALWTSLLTDGELVAARPHLEQGLRLYEPERHRGHAALYSGHDPGVCCRMQAAQSLWLLGYPDQAVASSQAALGLAQQLAHPLSLTLALHRAAVVHYLRREAPLTQARAKAAMTIATEQEFLQPLAQATPLRGWALAASSQGEEGITQIHQSLAAYQAIGATRYRPYHLALLAEVSAQMGQIAAGLEALAEALATVAKSSVRWWEAELHRLRGELLLQSSVAQPEEAEACFQQALAVARREQAKSWELRAAMSLSRLWQQQGKQAEVRELLAPVYGWFTEGFDTADLQEAKALLEELA
ncbi:MAG: ATP-binding protein [Candidatus Entotheonellia bacterium]